MMWPVVFLLCWAIAAFLVYVGVFQARRDRVPQDLHVVLTQEPDEPARCRVYDHGTLLFDGWELNTLRAVRHVAKIGADTL